MRLILLFFILFQSILSFGQGEFKTYYTNGSIRESFQYVLNDRDTIREGRYEIWYPSEILWQEGIYSNNQLDSIWLDYHPNGILKQELPYSNGKLEGKVYTFDSTGNKYQVHQ